MSLSLFLYGLPLGQYSPIIEAAERAGFAAVWLGDHVIAPEHSATPNPYAPPGHFGMDTAVPIADVWTTLAHAAGATSTILLGTGVYVLPLRHVLVTARSAASVQALSGGRLLFGVGTGWLREEFDALGEDFARRNARTDEIIDALQQLWRGDAVSFAGEHVSFPEVRLAPPVEVAIPIIGGGTSPRALERTARVCDGWFGPSGDLSMAIDARAAIDARRAQLGRTQPFQCFVRPAGPVDASTLRRCRDEGFADVVLSLKQVEGASPATTLERRLAAIASVAERLS